MIKSENLWVHTKMLSLDPCASRVPDKQYWIISDETLWFFSPETEFVYLFLCTENVNN